MIAGSNTVTVMETCIILARKKRTNESALRKYVAMIFGRHCILIKTQERSCNDLYVKTGTKL